MPENVRAFQAVDPFGRRWDVEFRWLQNAISIRHADAIDLKYYISDGEEKREVVVALPHADLVRLAKERGRELTDAWCLHLGARHLAELIRSWEDMERPVAVVAPKDLERHIAALESEAAEAVRAAAARR